MKYKSIRLAAVVFIAAAGHAQVTSHVAAAAGAAIGTAGGKVLSNVLDKALAPAAQTGDTQPVAKVPLVPTPATPTVASGSIPDTPPQGDSSSPGSSRRNRSTQRPYYSSTADRMAFRGSYQRLPPPPSVEDFAKIKAGSSRQEVLAALGTPSSHVTIPEEGHLIEQMSYQYERRYLGSVRLDNGRVVEIKSAR
ncbi:MAG: hypothetical protein ABSH09_09210 [Bryobacteraceae bacterium]|jgi:hypothetical protein